VANSILYSSYYLATDSDDYQNQSLFHLSTLLQEVALGTVPGAFSTLKVPEVENFRVTTDVRAAIVGGTDSDISISFRNGAVTDSFDEASEQSQRGKVLATFQDKDFRDAVAQALADTRREVDGEVERTGLHPGSLGLAVYESNGGRFGGRFDFGENPGNIPNKYAVVGRKPAGAFGSESVEAAAAIVIRVPDFMGNPAVTDAINRSIYNDLARDIDGLVVVRGKITDIWVFTGQGDPVRLEPGVFRQ